MKSARAHKIIYHSKSKRWIFWAIYNQLPQKNLKQKLKQIDRNGVPILKIMTKKKQEKGKGRLSVHRLPVS